MAGETGSKINRLLKAWPSGTVAVSPWLERQGVYQQLAREYEKTAWVQRIGQSAYIKAGDNVDWTGGLYAIQKQLLLPIHAGGKSALQIQGYAHYLPLGKNTTVILFGSPGTKLPAWFKQHAWDVKVRYITTQLLSRDAVQGMTKKEMGTYSISLSAPERAMLEVLYSVPTKETYDEAKLLMEGLTTLRPRVIQTLLERCASQKVKRLFMVLAESCAHPWLKKLDLSNVDFGKSKRMLVRGGRFDSKYNISVPE